MCSRRPLINERRYTQIPLHTLLLNVFTQAKLRTFRQDNNIQNRTHQSLRHALQKDEGRGVQHTATSFCRRKVTYDEEKKTCPRIEREALTWGAGWRPAEERKLSAWGRGCRNLQWEGGLPHIRTRPCSLLWSVHMWRRIALRKEANIMRLVQCLILSSASNSTDQSRRYRWACWSNPW